MPIGRNRGFIRAAAATDAPADPPPARIATAANWAEPANTTADITIAASTGKPASRASTPTDVDSSAPTAAYVIAARKPALNDARRGPSPERGRVDTFP